MHLTVAPRRSGTFDGRIGQDRRASSCRRPDTAPRDRDIGVRSRRAYFCLAYSDEPLKSSKITVKRHVQEG